MKGRFNTDILADEADRQVVRSAQPALYHVLHNGPLVAAFRLHDRAANRAKARRQFLGRTAVGLGFVALICITARLLLEATGRHAPATLVYASEICLLLALVLPPLVLRPLRRRWLEARLMTERLRQWHFEWILRNGAAVEATCRPAADGGLAADPARVEVYESERQQALDRFLRRMSRLDLRLESTLADRLPDLGIPSAPFAADSPVLAPLFAAWDHLRFEHQIDYARAKLAEHAGGSLTRQQRLYETAGAMALTAGAGLCVAVLLLHALHDLQVIADPLAVSPWWPALAICLALGGVAIRALESGLGLAGAVARYRNYAAAVELLRARFHAAEDPARKLAIMREMEDTAARETTLFLAQQSRSSFAV